MSKLFKYALWVTLVFAIIFSITVCKIRYDIHAHENQSPLVFENYAYEYCGIEINREEWISVNFIVRGDVLSTDYASSQPFDYYIEWSLRENGVKEVDVFKIPPPREIALLAGDKDTEHR